MSYNVKHSKFKNTGFLYEILIRQLSLDIINDRPKKPSFNILKKYFFNQERQLNKQLMLYNVLSSNKKYDKDNSKQLLEYTLEMRNRLNQDKLSKEKYFLIGDIKKNFIIQEIFNTKINNYRLLASIYKLFTLNSQVRYNPQQLIQNKITILNFLQQDKKPHLRRRNKDITNFLKQDRQIRHLSYNLLIEDFNKGYNDLLQPQKRLLHKYLNGLGDISIINNYINQEKQIIKNSFNSFMETCDDATRIKLKYLLQKVMEVGNKNFIDDNQIQLLMKVYQLLQEFK